MAIDFTQELIAALRDPKVGAVLVQHIKPAMQQVLTEHHNREEEVLLDATACGRLFCPTAKHPAAAWASIRRRHPEVDQVSLGFGRRRRWKRADLERLGLRRSQPRSPVTR